MNSSNNTYNESPALRNSASRITEVDKANKEFLDTSNNQKKKTDVSEFSHSKTQDKTQDKTPSRVIDNKNFSSHTNSSNINSPYKNRDASSDTSAPTKKLRSKTEKEGVINKKFKKKVTFKEKNFLDVVTVESFKKFNVDMSFSEMNTHETIRCKCIIY